VTVYLPMKRGVDESTPLGTVLSVLRKNWTGAMSKVNWRM